MIQYFSAMQIFPVKATPIKNGVIAVQADGKIEAIYTQAEAEKLNLAGVLFYEGTIVPGFVNTHCHLELSHMQGHIPEHTGLAGFVQYVIKQRQAVNSDILSAMQQADATMYRNGIVAVGDISNQIISKSAKEKSKINYHTFIEVMGFHPAKAESIMEHAQTLKKEFEPLKTSVVPHAPYSVSAALFNEIYTQATDADILSIHNQETKAENDFFEDKSGDFLKLYEFLGLNIDFFEPNGKTSLQSYLPLMPKNKTLLVHNTVSSQADIDFATSQHNNLYWCLCPKANLYIENKLPNVALLMNENLKITLGTDSLASNHELNILAEMQILQQHKNIQFEELLTWATLNGAEFLGFADELGSIEVGKKPGLNLIQLSENNRIESSAVKRII